MTIHELFSSYAADHRHPINRLAHVIGIPLIAFHVIAMLDWLHLAGPLSVSAGHVALLAAVAFTARFDRRIAAGMLGAGIVMSVLARFTPVSVVVVAAVVGWTIQLAGHVVFERNKPSFAKNAVHAIVGPMFLVDALLGKAGVDSALDRG